MNRSVLAATAFAPLVSPRRVSNDVVVRVRAVLDVSRTETRAMSTLFRGFRVWRHVTRREAAARLGVPVGELDSALVAACGLDFIHVRRHMAIRQVIAALVSTPAPLKYIAIDLGYFHQTAMARDFQICTGVSPRTFRARWTRG